MHLASPARSMQKKKGRDQAASTGRGSVSMHAHAKSHARMASALSLGVVRDPLLMAVTLARKHAHDVPARRFVVGIDDPSHVVRILQFLWGLWAVFLCLHRLQLLECAWE